MSNCSLFISVSFVVIELIFAIIIIIINIILSHALKTNEYTTTQSRAKLSSFPRYTQTKYKINHEAIIMAHSYNLINTANMMYTNKANVYTNQLSTHVVSHTILAACENPKQNNLI